MCHKRALMESNRVLLEKNNQPSQCFFSIPMVLHLNTLISSTWLLAFCTYGYPNPKDWVRKMQSKWLYYCLFSLSRWSVGKYLKQHLPGNHAWTVPETLKVAHLTPQNCICCQLVSVQYKVLISTLKPLLAWDQDIWDIILPQWDWFPLAEEAFFGFH